MKKQQQQKRICIPDKVPGGADIAAREVHFENHCSGLLCIMLVIMYMREKSKLSCLCHCYSAVTPAEPAKVTRKREGLGDMSFSDGHGRTPSPS